MADAVLGMSDSFWGWWLLSADAILRVWVGQPSSRFIGCSPVQAKLWSWFIAYDCFRCDGWAEVKITRRLGFDGGRHSLLYVSPGSVFQSGSIAINQFSAWKILVQVILKMWPVETVYRDSRAEASNHSWPGWMDWGIITVADFLLVWWFLQSELYLIRTSHFFQLFIGSSMCHCRVSSSFLHPSTFKPMGTCSLSIQFKHPIQASNSNKKRKKNIK